jgi:hypothetical protein
MEYLITSKRSSQGYAELLTGISSDRSEAENMLDIGVPYGNRTRVAAVKEKRPIVIQGT